MRRHTPGPRAAVAGIRQGLRASGILSTEGCVPWARPAVLLGSTGVDVFSIHGVFHEGNVVIGRQGEMRNAAHEAPHVLPVSVQSDFLHPTCREARGRWGEPEGSRSR